MRAVWKTVVNWFERGDLVPLMILVSAWHYAAVLAGKDALPVAIAIGLLVDLGHYRWVRAASGYRGLSRWEIGIRWTWAALFTVISLAYHQMYYADWRLSAPLPLLIASLAWLDSRKPAQASVEKAQAKTVETQAAVERAHVCVMCGRSFGRQQSLAAHMRSHRAQREETTA